MRLSIRAKLLGAFTVLSLFYIFASANVYLYSKSLNRVSKNNTHALEHFVEACALDRSLRSSVPMLIRYTDKNDLNEQDKFVNTWVAFENKADELEKAGITSEQQSWLEKIKPLREKINKDMEELFSLPAGNENIPTLELNIENSLNTIVTYLYEFRGESEKHLSSGFGQISNVSAVERNFAVSIFGMVILWFSSTFITSRLVTTPLSRLHKEVKLIAGGNFERRISIKTGDEIEELAEDFNEMFQSINDEQLTAATLQEKLLPPKRIRVKGIKLHAHQVQAKVVGGDWYDYYHTNNSVSFLIADASGKGMAGALVATLAMSSLRSEVKTLDTIGMVLKKTNRTIESRLGSGNFTTMFFGNLSLDTHELTYINCGHDQPFWYRHETDNWQFLESRPSLPLGISTEHFHPRKEKIQLVKGDKLLLYTDGLHDVRNKERKFFGLEAILNWLNNQETNDKHRSINEIIDELLDKALVYCERQIPDDITLLGLEVISDPATIHHLENITDEELKALVDGR